MRSLQELLHQAIRSAAFIGFLGIGAAAMSLAFLTDDLVRYYNRKAQLAYAQQMANWLEQLNNEYQLLISQLQQDPNILKRVAPAVLGIWPSEPNTAYPQANPQDLLAARQTFLLRRPVPQRPVEIPLWLQRCQRPVYRWAIILLGAGLVLVSFIWFARE